MADQNTTLGQIQAILGNRPISATLLIGALSASIGYTGAVQSGLVNMVGALSTTPMSYAAKGDCASDDTAAVMAAQGAVTSLSYMVVDRCYRITSSKAIPSNIKFLPGGALNVDAGATVALAGAIEADRTQQIFYGAGTAIVQKAGLVSVAWWGALIASAQGADAAPAFRAAVGSNRTYIVPPANYYFASYVPAWIGNNTTQPIGAAVQFKNLSNFTISAYGATFTQNHAVPYGNASAFMFFDGNVNFSLQGATFTGDVANAPVNTVTIALVNHNAVGFDFKDIHLAGNFGSPYNQEIGDGVAADYNVNGTYENFTMDRVGEAFDLAFLQNVTLKNNVITCGDPTDATKPGRTGFSNSYDTPGVGFNTTGNTIADTVGVTLENNVYNNCYYSSLIYSGQRYTFRGNYYGSTGNSPVSGNNGVGLWFDYISPGVSPSLITIDGNTFSGFQTGIQFNTGSAVQFNTVNVSSSNVFNGTTIGIGGSDASSPSHITNLQIGGPLFQAVATPLQNLPPISMGAWSAYTPGFGCGAGAATTTASAGRFKQDGKTVRVAMHLTDTTNGTCASYLFANLPVANGPYGATPFVGRDSGLTGKAVAGSAASGSQQMIFGFYDNTFAGANGAVFDFNQTYEAQ